MKRVAAWLILIFAFCGIADSAYLTQSQLSGTPLVCNISGASDCNIVAQSPYSKIFGIPLSEYGLLFYGLLFTLAAIELVLFTKPIRRAVQLLSIFGLACSLIFVYIQIAVIGAICIYCMTSGALTLLVFLFALFLEPSPNRLSK